jgi:hypothetical protein
MTTGCNFLRSRRLYSHSTKLLNVFAWAKLNKYYSLTDNAHSLFAAAVLLHPSLRKHYFDKYWLGDEAQWKDLMITNVKRVWEKEYKPFLSPAAEQGRKANTTHSLGASLKETSSLPY